MSSHPLVGAWRYVDALMDGKSARPGGKGIICYAPSGDMVCHVSPGNVAKAGAKPTPEEALAAWRSISGYFGRFITYENQNPPYVIHSQQGQANPGTYSDQQRFYQFTGDVLRLGGPPTFNAATGELEGGHLYWQRMKQGEK